MAEVKLNTATSVVDFLKSTNKPSDFRSRERMFRDLGLETRLGAFVGSSSQNTALLRTLQQQSNNAAPTLPSPVAQTGMTNLNRGDSLLVGGEQPFTGKIDLNDPSLREPFRLPSPVSPTGAAAFGVELPKTSAPATGVLAPSPTQPVQPTQPAATEEPAETPIAELTLDALGIPAPPSEEDILNSVLESPEFKLFQEGQEITGATAAAKAEALKAAAERKFEGDKTALEQRLAARGLFFSGIRSTQVAALMQDLAASRLGADRELAGKLLEQNLDVKEEILKLTEEVIKNAQNGRKEALASLEKVGFTIVGDQIVPTLAARNAAAVQARFEKSQRAIQERFERTEKRLIGGAEGGGDGSGGRFSRADLNKGSAAINISIDDFEVLDEEVQNYIIQNSSDIADRVTAIIQDFDDGVDPDSVKEGPVLDGLPPAVREQIIQKIDEIYFDYTEADKESYFSQIMGFVFPGFF